LATGFSGLATKSLLRNITMAYIAAAKVTILLSGVNVFKHYLSVTDALHCAGTCL